jgi:hypothetical protein
VRQNIIEAGACGRGYLPVVDRKQSEKKRQGPEISFRGMPQ